MDPTLQASFQSSEAMWKSSWTSWAHPERRFLAPSPNSARTGHATEGALSIFTQLSTDERLVPRPFGERWQRRWTTATTKYSQLAESFRGPMVMTVVRGSMSQASAWNVNAWPHKHCLSDFDSLSTALPKYAQRIFASVGETICSWHERQQETDTVKKSDSSHYKAPVNPLNVSGSAQKMSLTVLPRQQSW